MSLVPDSEKIVGCSMLCSPFVPEKNAGNEKFRP